MADYKATLHLEVGAADPDDIVKRLHRLIAQHAPEFTVTEVKITRKAGS